MSPVVPSPLVVALLGMGVVFVFLVFLSVMMAVLTAVATRRNYQAAEPKPDSISSGPGSLGWITAATAAFLTTDQAVNHLPSAVAWRPYDTADVVRWRLEPLSVSGSGDSYTVS
mgnify:CR=1 FL=1